MWLLSFRVGFEWFEAIDPDIGYEVDGCSCGTGGFTVIMVLLAY